MPVTSIGPVAVFAPGAMGAGIGQRLAGNGVEVRTSLLGRSRASAERAEAAGMHPVEDAAIADCAIILSIVPPAEVLGLAERLAPVGTRGRSGCQQDRSGPSECFSETRLIAVACRASA